MIQRSGEAAVPDDGGAPPGPPGPPDGTRALAGAILAGNHLAFGPRLVVVEGPSIGAAFALRDGAVLGRGRGAEIALGDTLASRRHALFTIRDGRARLRDLSSKNGVAVNGRRVGPAEISLDAGDALLVGESVLVYQDDPPKQAGGAPRALAQAHGRPSRLGRISALAAPGLAAVVLMTAALLLALAACG
jgi:pSer/pThr/pTyr-binding forkhead associated (FHA) protein